MYLCQAARWKTIQDRATVINSVITKPWTKTTAASMGEGTHKNTQLMELAITDSCDQFDILQKTEFLVKCHVKVTHHGREDHMKNGLNQQVQVSC